MSVLLVGLLAVAVISWLTNGDLRRLEKAPLRHGWLFIAALIVQFVIFLPGAGNGWLGGAVPYLYIASFAGIVIALALNWRTAGLPMAAVGVAMNLVAIVANGGYMPASRAAAEHAGRVAEYAPLAGRAAGTLVHANSLLAPDARLPFLGDVLWVRIGRAGTIFSWGDVVLMAGIAWLLIAYSRRPRGRHRAQGPGALAAH